MIVDRGEFNTFLLWLDGFYRSDAGLQRPSGLSLNGAPDFEGIAAWGFDVYLNARQNGRTPDQAQTAVMQQIRNTDEWRSKHPTFKHALGTRDGVLRGQTTQQGLMVPTTKYGLMPWWGACWAWLDQHTRDEAAAALIAHGDTILVIALPCGFPLYDEPNQFYSPDKFPTLDMTQSGTTITDDFTNLIIEAIDHYGFAGVWVFLGGDDGHRGAPVARAQVEMLGPQLVALGLDDHVAVMPGWDGVWHKPDGTEFGTGYTREDVFDFADVAHAAGIKYVGIEQGTGYMLAGDGGNDYGPGGVMHGYQLVLLEFEDGVFNTDDDWQILGRLCRPYVRPADQPAPDDPNPPFVCAGPSSDGEPPVIWIFEYHMYDGVRGEDPNIISADRDKFHAMCPATHIA